MSVKAISDVSVNASETQIPKMQQIEIPSIAAANKEPKTVDSRVRQTQEAKQKERSAEQKYNEVMTEKAVENANNRIKYTKTNAKFEYNEDIDRITITITDEDNEVIKEIPPEATQKMLERIHTFSGMVLDEEV